MEIRKQPRKTNGSKIAEIRIARGLTQQQLADRSGIYLSTLSRWECGHRSPTVANLMKIAIALDVSIEDLL